MSQMDVDKPEVEVDELLDDDDYEEEEEQSNEIYETALTPNTAQMLTTHALHTMIHEGGIDLNPVYQRDVVWPEHKQIGLIDSLFRNYFIPPVIFAVQPNEDGDEVRICVDGKQRLTSIQKFFDGLIPHRNTRTKKSYWYTMSTNESSKALKTELPEKYKAEFRDKIITVVEYRNLTAGSEREIFQRVQLGMSLTAAEKLQAIASPWAEWISNLEARHVRVEAGLAQKLDWDVTRGRDFQNLAHMVYCCCNYPEEFLPTAQKIEKWIARVDPPGQQFQEDIENVLRRLWVIASTPPLNEGFKKIEKRVAPVEFVFIGVLLYVLRNQSREVQAKAIYILRSAVREDFKDIRNNTTVGKALWSYIQALKHNPTKWLVPGVEEQTKGKRKKKGDLDDDDDEYRLGDPVRSIGTAPKTRAKKVKAS
ncbi:hypothetical protein BDN70DRAFT_871293 [Pholiota conissans]|uniref:GmrSD restriction endonucleases N-terminal domain-containing protein n=1 Tax=Pholiota conissans TaxID=109636 RepID=A0A9P5ZD66_9AGAR|nr:hypothetical protein BDN70DRAFT_871293 [Pholiota conissans]